MHRANVNSRRSFSGLIWQKCSGRPTDAVEKDRICCIFARPSCDSSANHAPSRCSDNEMNSSEPTLMPKKIPSKILSEI